MRKLLLLHPAAMARIEHPLRNLQCRRRVQLISHAAKNNYAAPSCLVVNIRPFPMPRMPRIPHFPDVGFMGVLYPSCTTANARIPAWGRKRQTRYTSTDRRRHWRHNAQSARPWN
jgi:hypothetical protein